MIKYTNLIYGPSVKSSNLTPNDQVSFHLENSEVEDATGWEGVVPNKQIPVRNSLQLLDQLNK